MDVLVAALKEVQATNNKALKHLQISRETREALHAANRAIAAELREIDRRNQMKNVTSGGQHNA